MKISIGLALQNAISHNHNVEALCALYSKPNLNEIKRIHTRLSMSNNHFDREIAVWLEPMLESAASIPDPRGLINEMREMEFLLYDLTNRATEAQSDMNNWMNSIANAAESLSDAFWFGAKILLSQALEISHSKSVECLKAKPGFTHELDILQRATEEYLNEMRKYPLRLAIPKGRIEMIENVQQIMLSLMRNGHQGLEQEHEMIGTVVRKLTRVIRLLMNENSELGPINQELKVAYEHLTQSMNRITGRLGDELLDCATKLGKLAEATAAWQNTHQDHVGGKAESSAGPTAACLEI